MPAGWGPLVMGAQLREGGVQFQTVASGDRAPSAHTSVRSGSSPEVSREALDPGGQGPRRIGLGVGPGRCSPWSPTLQSTAQGTGYLLQTVSNSLFLK